MIIKRPIHGQWSVVLRAKSKELGKAIVRRREMLGLKPGELARSVGVPQSYIHDWEQSRWRPKGHHLEKLTSALACSYSHLLGDKACNPSTGSGDPVREIGQSVQGAFGFSDSNPCDEEHVRSVVASRGVKAVLETCHAFLAQTAELRSGREFSLIRPELDWHVALARHSYERANPRDVADAKQIYLGTVDKRIHWHTFVMPAKVLGTAIENDRGEFAQLVLDDPSDVELMRRYYARIGDALKITATDDLNLNHRAFAHLNKGIERKRGKYRSSPGYHAVRSLVIVAARSNMSDSEFEATMRMAIDAFERGDWTAHEEAHVFEGIAEAYAIRQMKSRGRRLTYEQAALRAYQSAEARSLWATRDYGLHAEFDMRIMRLPLTLAQWGIEEPFAGYGMSARAKMIELAYQVADRAETDGNDRLAEQMAQKIRALDGRP